MTHFFRAFVLKKMGGNVTDIIGEWKGIESAESRRCQRFVAQQIVQHLHHSYWDKMSSVEKLGSLGITPKRRKQKEEELCGSHCQYEIRFQDLLIYVVERKMGSSRRMFLMDLARKKGFRVADIMRYGFVRLTWHFLGGVRLRLYGRRRKCSSVKLQNFIV